MISHSVCVGQEFRSSLAGGFNLGSHGTAVKISTEAAITWRLDRAEWSTPKKPYSLGCLEGLSPSPLALSLEHLNILMTWQPASFPKQSENRAALWPRLWSHTPASPQYCTGYTCQPYLVLGTPNNGGQHKSMNIRGRDHWAHLGGWLPWLCTFKYIFHNKKLLDKLNW